MTQRPSRSPRFSRFFLLLLKSLFPRCPVLMKAVGNTSKKEQSNFLPHGMIISVWCHMLSCWRRCYCMFNQLVIRSICKHYNCFFSIGKCTISTRCREAVDKREHRRHTVWWTFSSVNAGFFIMLNPIFYPMSQGRPNPFSWVFKRWPQSYFKTEWDGWAVALINLDKLISSAFS